MTARIAVIALVGAATTAVQAAPEPLPAESPFVGVMWSYVVPAILFAVACGATIFLYRHFAERDQ